ncbi:MAG: phosphoglyceromutase [Verrucomicrobia bacterium]|nr:phosphoglyceromutase [Verrucomicrobiota bacterium]
MTCSCSEPILTVIRPVLRWQPSAMLRSSPLRRLFGHLLTLLLLCPGLNAVGADRRTENVVLITLDGVRVEEMFGGIDMTILKSVTKDKPVEKSALYQKYWASTPEERREKLMPFFWSVLMKEHGSIAGNRAKGSTVQLTNGHRFSYPGYSEILTGEAHDEVIKSNDKIQNPYPTVLEFLKEQLNLASPQVAAFASWDVMKWIAERTPNTITINAGFEPYDHPSPEIRMLSMLQHETSTPWDSVRHDVYTHRFAMAHLRAHKPRVLYLSLGETDDWAHDERYDRVLQALERTDLYFSQLWDYLQTDDQYRGKTSLLITTDHGRGIDEKGWGSHSAKLEGAQYIWIAFVSPDSALRGEWSNSETLYQNQTAATLCRFLGLDFNASHSKSGKPVSRVFQAP